MMLEDASASLFTQYLRIARLLAGQLDFQSAIHAVAKEVAMIIPHDHLDVCIITPGSTFHTAYESGLQTEWSKRPPASIGESPIRALLIGAADHILTADAMNDPRFHFDGAFSDPIRQHKLRSRLHVALRVRGETIGALSCSSLAPNDYSPRDVEHAQSIADLLAPYFFALRAAEETKRSAIVEAEMRVREEALLQGAARLTEALEAERQRIGMDLHDQTLADMTRFAKRLERLSLSENLHGGLLEPLFKSLQQSMQDLRQIIEEARPSVLQLFGLVEAIENHLDRSVRDSGMPIEWHLDDETNGASEALSQSVSNSLFRIAQEAINNAVRHSQAERISVTLRMSEDHLLIEIRDNGIGMAHNRDTGGSGIDNMRTRARLIAASFRCGSDKGETFVRIRVPLASVEEDA